MKLSELPLASRARNTKLLKLLRPYPQFELCMLRALHLGSRKSRSRAGHQSFRHIYDCGSSASKFCWLAFGGRSADK